MNWQNIFKKLKEKKSLVSGEMEEAMETIVAGNAHDDEIESFLVLLREKGETGVEIAAASQVMRKHSHKLSKHYPDLLDTCGTGADNQQTLNISTIAAVVAASAGVQVGKHGNRAVSSVCGSADLLELLGVKIDLAVSRVEQSIDRVGFGFFFAPHFHPGMRFAAAARKKIKGKTLFNLLGPLSNPGGASHQLIGVYDKRFVETAAEALSKLGTRRALVVHGMDGLDEISICDKTWVAELEQHAVRTYFIDPQDFGFKRASLKDLQCRTKEEYRESALDVLEGKGGPKSDVVCLNAGAALYVAGKVPTIKEGVQLAREVIEDDLALDKLNEIAAFSQAAGE